MSFFYISTYKVNTMEHNREYSDAFFRLLNWAFFSKMSIYGLRENILLNYITETESYGRHFYRFFLFVIFCGLSFLSSCDWRYVPIDQIWLRFCNFKIIFQKYLKYFINILTKLFKSKVFFRVFPLRCCFESWSSTCSRGCCTGRCNRADLPGVWPVPTKIESHQGIDRFVFQNNVALFFSFLTDVC